MFAELAILQLLERAGWEGVWVDSFSGPKFRKTSLRKNEGAKLPKPQQELFARIRHTAKTRGGCWDVFCWRGNAVLFAESKRKSKDRIRDTQLNWLQAALACGVREESFLIVEWTIR